MAVGPALIVQNLTGTHPEERDLHGLPPEPVFLRLLRLERRRTERSRQPFVLMVLGRESRAADEPGSSALERAVSALLSAIRETDVAGWCKDRCLGVILAEHGAKDKGAVIEALRARMTEALRSRLRPDEFGQLRLSFHWFPDDWKDRDSGNAPTVALYPDLVQREESRKIPIAIKRAVDIAGSALALSRR